jgi:hypothetical protein
MKNANGNSRDGQRFSIVQGFFCAALLLAGLTAACGGGGGTVAPPPPTGMYSLSSLSGSYAFTMTGEDGSGDPIIRIGSFQADGAGNITAAIEDVNDSGTIDQFLFTPAPTSVYTMNGDGKGVLTLVHPDAVVAGTNDVFTFTITLTSTSGGLMIETDGSSTMSGTFTKQSITANFAPSYAFDTSGVDLNLGASESIVGAFTTNGTSAVTGGTLDDNDAATPSGPSPIGAGTLALDPTYGSQYGRGSFQINTTIGGQIFSLTFEFYVVDGNHLYFVEEDVSGKATAGTATAQSAVPTSVAQLNGNFVLAVGGGTFNQGLFGPLTRAAVVAPNGNGALTSAVLDQNFSNGPSVFPASGSSISAAAYTIDASGDGRGTLSFTDVKSGFQFVYVFYLATASQGYIQDDSGATTADGSLTAQTANLSSSSIAGNYAFNWSGINTDSANEEDFVGVFTIPSGGGAITNGVVDFVQFGVKNPHTDQGLTGTFTLNGTGTGGGTAASTLQLVSSNADAPTANFHVYAISNTSFILVGVDTTRQVIGPLQLQQ